MQFNKATIYILDLIIINSILILLNLVYKIDISFYKLISIINIVWIIDIIWYNKFANQTKNIWNIIYCIFRSNLFMLLLTTMIIVIFYIQQVERFYILLCFVIYFILETLLIIPLKIQNTQFNRHIYIKEYSFPYIKSFLFDMLLMLISIIIIHGIKHRSFMKDEISVYSTIILIGLWFFFSLWTEKFQRAKVKNIYYYFTPFLRTWILMSIVTAFIIFIVNFKEYSRIMLFGPIIFLAVFESIFFLTKQFMIRLNNEESGYINYEKNFRHFQQKELPLKKMRRINSKKSILNILKKNFLMNHIRLFQWIAKNIDLKYISYEETSILDTHTLFNLKIIDDDSKMLIINLHPANDFGRINSYFHETYKKLKNGGYFVGSKTTLFKNKELIYTKYPQYLAHLRYSINFLFHRIIPKINGINLFYFVITKGKNRLISKAEILGRLSFCGFRIIDFHEQKGINYFIAQKYKTPSLDQNPSYGPIIKLKRIGPHGHSFEIYKFRTMHPYSEYIQDFIYDRNKLQRSGKIANDYRLTHWGKILRKFWIDELPQLANLIKGDLKLVGVRALSYHYFSLYPKDVKRMRFKTKPGIFPPYYADMPETFDEIIKSERKYLSRYFKKPIRTDFIYFFKILYNILFKNARSR